MNIGTSDSEEDLIKKTLFWLFDVLSHLPRLWISSRSIKSHRGVDLISNAVLYQRYKRELRFMKPICLLFFIFGFVIRQFFRTRPEYRVQNNNIFNRRLIWNPITLQKGFSHSLKHILKLFQWSVSCNPV